MTLVTPAVVLRTVDYGESDRVATLLTHASGKVSAIARGARRSRRRFGAALALFGVGEATLSGRSGAELYRLERFDSARGFPGLLADVAKMAHASYACELVRELAPPHEPEPELFALLTEFLGLLDEAPARAEALRVLELRVLEAVGLRPELERCVGCGAPATDGEGQAFDPRRGGLVCAACHLGGGRPFGAEVRAELHRVQGEVLAGGPAIDPAMNAALRELIAALLLVHLGRPLRSLAFIAKLNQAGA